MDERELLSAAETVFDGWYANAPRIDWDDFLDRLESLTGVDLGNTTDSPLIRKIRFHIAEYRRLSP